MSKDTVLSGDRTGFISEELGLKELLSLYTSYYMHHADLRMKLFGEFISVEPALIGGYFGAYKLFKETSGAIFPLCALSIAMSFVAFLILCMDLRTTELLHQVRVALRTLEDTYEYTLPVEMRLFTSVKRNEHKLNFSFLSRVCYALLIFVGFAFLLVSFLLCRR